MLSRTAIFLSLLLPLGAAACTPDAPTPTPVVEAAESAADAPEPAATGEGQPKLVIESEHDFGPVQLGQTVEHTFTLTNAGDADLHIEKVQKT